ncbi:MAG: nitroreductase family deazaflavin-dependent oxidoreductase [Candidatus Dormibacter sp.]|uniref:nitroreductase family deazaflavin-dependent oxidoreductase n=1 Tax=Candidatus Dormibacter sp. TaxID=2973982 RepID=UPI000DB2B3BB|nr:MAG: nitroreductase family deazaflavin-dependent oxidoreductase [Candidatus Dormibacteraeota bacterium]
MPLPKRLARFNRRVTNRVLGPLAGRAPWFGLVGHRGRLSGQFLWTPVNVFCIPEGYVIALMYGQDSQWARNVLAAQRCVLKTRRGEVHLREPRVVRDPGRRLVPAAIRPILRALDVEHFLVAWPATPE